MLLAVLAVGIVVCAVLAIRTGRVLHAALWLAGCSACLSILLYLLGAPEIAVIELSVGAGLVTVLFIFALNLISDQSSSEHSSIPKVLSVLLPCVSLLMLAALTVPLVSSIVNTGSASTIQTVLVPAVRSSFAAELWQQRGLDALLQAALIFVGILGVLGLLAGVGTRTKPAAASQVTIIPIAPPINASEAEATEETLPEGELQHEKEYV